MSQPITAQQRKLIASLKQTKYRRAEQLFVLEGTRAVIDTVPFFTVVYLVATAQWLDEYGNSLPAGMPTPLVAKRDEMERMSSLTTPQGVLAVCRMPEHSGAVVPAKGELLLALDCVQDPGNLGTIMRVADWFGVTRILASTDTVDVYNPKVIQASMGAVARVEVHYCNLAETLQLLSAKMPIYGTFLDGDNIYNAQLSSAGGVIVMGNEGNGISAAVGKCVNSRLKIPTYPSTRETVESLNVSMATGIVLAEFRRRCAK